MKTLQCPSATPSRGRTRHSLEPYLYNSFLRCEPKHTIDGTLTASPVARPPSRGRACESGMLPDADP